MKIIKAYPPNFSPLKKAFPFIVGRPGILYAWGDRIYNPSGVKVQPWLLAHEEVHGRQQTSGPYNEVLDVLDVLEWWDSYINLPAFRLKQEIEAHRVEWKAYLSTFPENSPFDPCPYLERMAERLSSPLYGNMISKAEAKHEIADNNYGRDKSILS